MYEIYEILIEMEISFYVDNNYYRIDSMTFTKIVKHWALKYTNLIETVMLHIFFTTNFLLFFIFLSSYYLICRSVLFQHQVFY